MIYEAQKYFKDDRDRECKASNYAKQQGACTGGVKGNCFWLLRSPGYSQSTVAYVSDNGAIFEAGFGFIAEAFRPALFINLYIGDEKMKCPKCGKIWSDFNSIASNTYICPYCGDNFALDGEVREDISQILKKLVEDFGKDVLLDVSRTNALLMDYAPHSKKERKLIVMVMKEGILSQLLCLANKTDDEKKFGINKCIKQLISDIWITEDAARYAITVLANAVGCLSGNDLD